MGCSSLVNTASDCDAREVPITTKPLLNSLLEKDKFSISFLLNWKDPHKHITDKFEGTAGILDDTDFPNGGNRAASTLKGALRHKDGGLHVTEHRPVYTSPAMLSDLPNNTSTFAPPYDFNDLSSGFFFPFYTGVSEDPTQQSEDVAGFACIFDIGIPTRDIAAELVDSLAAFSISSSTSAQSDSASDTSLAAVMALIEGSNIHSLLGLYFLHFNRHSPVIHRGTFDFEQAASPPDIRHGFGRRPLLIRYRACRSSFKIAEFCGRLCVLRPTVSKASGRYCADWR